MKPFSLEQAKNGNPVITRDGRKVKILRQLVTDDGYDLLCDVNGSFVRYRTDGKYLKNCITDSDLMMADEKELSKNWSDQDLMTIFESIFEPVKKAIEQSKIDSPEIIPFDINKARTKGVEVRTRSGYEANIITSEVKGKYPIVAIVKFPDNTEQALTYTIDGVNSVPNPDLDLVLVRVKREGWIIRDHNKSEDFIVKSTLFQKKEDAEEVLKKLSNPDDLYITEVTYFQ